MLMRAPVLAFFRRQNGRAFFPPLPIAALFPRSWRWADSNGDAWDASKYLEYFRNEKKASMKSNPRWHFLRAGGPVARRRSFLFH